MVVRAIAGYTFAFTSLLYTQLGKPQERDRLEQKDNLFSQLRQDKDALIEKLRQDKDALIAELRQQLTEVKAENEKVKTVLAETKTAHARLINDVNKSDEDALQAYSQECKSWLKSGIKTVNADEISRFTGHSKRKIQGAINAGNLLVSTRNKELILVSSLAQWLKETPAPVTNKEPETGPLLHVVNG
jgi:hypothetical protein